MPGPFVRTVLEQAWADVLALTLLRQGEDSESYRKRIEIADRLIESSAPATETNTPSPPPEELREEIETGLSQVGYHQEDIRAVVNRLLVPDSAANDDVAPLSRTELASKLASKPRLGDDPGGDSFDEAGRNDAMSSATELNPSLMHWNNVGKDHDRAEKTRTSTSSSDFIVSPAG